MNTYEIGKDIQDLKSRVDRVERICRAASYNPELEQEGIDFRDFNPDKRRNLGRSVLVDSMTGVDFDQKPILWELEKKASFPPILAGLVGFSPTVLFDVAPQSKTWGCVPEPLIVDVSWADGTKEESFRFVDQVFSIIRVTDPNTGVVKATAIYTARFIHRSGCSIDYAGGYAGGASPPTPPYYVGPVFIVTLRSAGGAGLFKYGGRFSVYSGANNTIIFSSDFPPGLYDLVTGATWEMPYWSMQRC